MTPPTTAPVRRLLASHALAAVAMSLPWPLLLVLVHDRAGTGLLVGLTGAARMLPYVALSWATGSLADRFARDLIVRATLVARALCLVAVAVCVAQDWLVAAVLCAAGAIACGTPAYPALAAAMPGVAGAARRRATDLLVTIEVASFVVGPAIGGLLLHPTTRPWVPAVAVVTTVVALVLVLPVSLPRGVAGGPTRVGPALRRPGVLGAVATVAVLNLVLAATGLALLPLVEGTWGAEDAGFGLATGALGFGALAAPLLWRLGRTARGRTRAGLLLLVVALAVVPWSPGLLVALPVLGLVGAAAVHVESAATETIQDAVPDSQRAGVLGVTDTAMVGAALLGSLVAPSLADLLGAAGLLVLLALACAAALLPTRTTEQVEVSRPAPSVRIPEQRARPRTRSSSAAAPRG